MPYAHRWERGEILIAQKYLDQPFFFRSGGDADEAGQNFGTLLE